MSQLIVIRGVPGSGKTTLARTVQADLELSPVPTHIIEMDDWRMVDGVYVYNPEDNDRISKLCFARTHELLKAGANVIVANTFIRRLYVAPYQRLATQLGCAYQEYICNGKFRSTHDVDPVKVQAMRRQFEL